MLVNQHQTISQFFNEYCDTLRNRVPVASGELAKSIDFVINDDNTIEILMANYGKYLDKGVSGTERKFNTPYSYTNRMPPASVFDKWIVRKGIAPRNGRGQFQSRKGLQFAIARSIYKNGIRPTLFISIDFDAKMNQFANILANSVADDLMDEIDNKIK
jgi:hypothetical protein